MKCEIIKDLLPSYVDGLTSNESNFEIQEHLKECSQCKITLEEMKAEIRTENIEVNKEKIKPFKKLNKKLLKAVLITLTSCILVAGIYLYLFGFGWSVNSKDLTKTYLDNDINNTINIQFELTNGKALHVWRDYYTDKVVVKFTESFNNILDDRGEHPNQFLLGTDYKDENGKLKVFTDNDCIIMHFKDKTETIYWKDIAKELGVQ